MLSGLEMKWYYSGRKGEGMDKRRKYVKQMRKGKRGKVKKSKR